MDNNFDDKTMPLGSVPDLEQTQELAQGTVPMQETAEQPTMVMQEAAEQPTMVMQEAAEQPTIPMQNTEQQPTNNVYSDAAQNVYAAQMAPQMGEATPGQPVINGKKVKKPKKKLSKGAIAGIACGGAAAVAAIACAIIFLIVPMFKPDKDVVVDAFKNTFDASNEEAFLDEYFGLSDILEAFINNGGDYSVEMSLAEIPDVPEIPDIKIRTAGSYDYANKLLNSSVAFVYDDQSIISAEMYGTKDKTYLAVPDLLDAYFYIENENFLEKLKDSPLLAQADVSGIPSVLLDLDIDYFPEQSEDTQDTEIVPEYVDAIEELWDNVKVKKQGKAKIDVNDEVLKATEYYVTFKEENIEDALASLITGALSNADFMSGMMAGEMEIDPAQLAMMSQQVAALVPSIVSDDLVIKVYIKDKKVVKITSANDVNFMGVVFEYDFSFDYYDDDITVYAELSVNGEKAVVDVDINDIKGNSTGVVRISVGSDYVEYSYNTTKENTDALYKVNTEINFSENGNNEGSVTIESNFDKDSNKFETLCTITDTDGESAVFSYSGKVNSFEKGVSIDVTFDEAKLTADGVSLAYNLNFNIDTSKISAKEPNSSFVQYNIATMNEDDMTQLIMDNQNKMMEWAMNLMNTPFGQLLEELNIGGDDDDITEIETEYGTILTDDEGNEVVDVCLNLDGYELLYSDEYYVDYSDENGCVIEYVVDAESNGAANALTEYVFSVLEESELIYNCEELAFGDAVVYVSGWVDMFGYTQYVATRQIDDDTVVKVSICVVDEHPCISDLATAAACLSDDNINILK